MRMRLRLLLGIVLIFTALAAVPAGALAGPFATPAAPTWNPTVELSAGAEIKITFAESASSTTVVSGPPTIGGTNAGDWSIVPTGSIFECSAGYYLNATYACEATLRFTPKGTGERLGTLTLFGTDFSTSNAVAVIVNLTGSGTSAPTATPTSVAFGSLAVGAATTQRVTIANAEALSTAIDLANAPFATSGTSSAEFAIASSTCATSLPVDASCTVDVTFAPTSSGAKAAALELRNDLGSVVLSVPLSGSATAQSGVAFSAPTPTFATTTIGTSSTAVVTVTNNGPSAAQIGTLGITGAGAAAFSLTAFNTCTGQKLGFGGTCAVGIDFTPTVAGTASATLEVPSVDLVLSPYPVALTATGTVAVAPTPPPAANVTYCHKEGGPNFVLLTTAPEIVVQAGHPNHAADVIPPFSYLKSGRLITFAGQNWDAAGQALLAAGCVEPVERTATPEPPVQRRVSICHREGGPNYVAITAAAQGVYDGHVKNHPLDIIPPFSFEQAGQRISFQGQNWDAEGQMIVANGCRPLEPTEPAVPAEKVTLCHKQGGPNFVRITVAPQAALNAHDKNHPLDIIPPFSYTSGRKIVRFAGQNWTADGRATYYAGCEDPTPPAQPIEPTVQCIEVGAGTFTAWFGYGNLGAQRTIPVGARNAVGGSGAARGQTTTFEAGSVARAFAVADIPDGASATWTVAAAGSTTTATATRQSPACAPPPAPADAKLGLVSACVVRSAGSFSAVFGYQNDESVPLIVPVGDDNALVLSSAPRANPDRGQPSTFTPGSDTNAFTVRGIPSGATATWTVVIGGRIHTTTASASDPRCANTPDPNPPPVVQPDPVGIFVTCVRPNGNGTYDAIFGYANPNHAALDVAVGDGNAVAPGEQGQGQPTRFMPGTVTNAWTATWIPLGETRTWTVGSTGTTSATATGTAERCPGSPPDDEPPVIPPLPPEPPRPDPTAEASIGVFATCVTVIGRTFNATFGYISTGTSPTTIPVGARNRFAGSDPDRGQPTTFTPGTEAGAFTVLGAPIAERPTWRVTGPDGRSAEATADPTVLPDCITEPRRDDPDLVPDLPPPIQPPTEDTPTPRIGEVENPGTTPIDDVVVVFPDGPAADVVKARGLNGAVCRMERGRAVLRVDRLLPGQTARCQLRVRVDDCDRALIQSAATGRDEVGAITAPTGQSVGVSRCRARAPQPVTG